MPLGPDAIRDLLADLLGNDVSIEGLAGAIHERTAGNPFFTEEVVQALIEAGNLTGDRGDYRLVTPIERLEVPSTVQSVLAARIDRLTDQDKQVLQTASVIGKEFSEPILEAVAEISDATLAAALQALKDNEFIYQQSLYPISEYAFKHPLTQEVALGSQLKERRARVHGAVARALEASQPDRLQELSALLAHHYEQAGETLVAVGWHLRAADWLLISSVSEAISHWERVYELTRSLPATREAMEHRCYACEMLLSNAWRTGLTEDRWEQLAREGKELAERLGDRHRLFNVLIGLSVVRYLCGLLKDAVEPSQEAIALAEELGDAESLCSAYNIHLNILWHGGTLQGFGDVARKVIDLAKGDLSIGRETFALSIPNWSVGMDGGAAWMTGRPAEATAKLNTSRRVAQDAGETEVVVWCLQNLAELGSMTGADDQSLQRAQRSVELSEQIGSQVSLIMGYQQVGHAHLARGEAEAALPILERAEKGCRELGVARHRKSTILGDLAEACRCTGQLERGLVLAREGVEFGREAETHVYKLQALLPLVRCLRILDVAAHRDEIADLLNEGEETVATSGALAFGPFVAEERSRVATALGETAEAKRWLREAMGLFAAVDADGHVERIRRELGD